MKKEQILLLSIVLLGIFLRIYRAGDLLWFNFDQGRDALVVWDLLNKGKFFLIGPTTGIAGIFLGPAYYYMASVFYFLSGGNPAGAAVFTGTLGGLGVFFVYLLASQKSKTAGILSAVLTAFSFNWILNDRWLSNTTALSVSAPLAVLLLYLSPKKRILYFAGACFLLGLNLQFESSGAFFTLFAALFWIIISKIYQQKKKLFFGVLAFFSTLIPEIIFELRHGFLMTGNFYRFITAHSGSEPSFAYPTNFIMEQRIIYLFKTFGQQIEPNASLFALLLIAVSFIVIWASGFWKKDLTKLLFLWILIPVLLSIFFRGNNGQLFSYYLNPVLPVFFAFLGTGLSIIFTKKSGKSFVFIILAVFLWIQIEPLKNFLRDGLEGYNTIALGNQIKAVDWIYQKNSGKHFDVDILIPPVTPYSYTYLFNWYGGKKYGLVPDNYLYAKFRKANNEKIFYVLYEYDNRYNWVSGWLSSKDGSSKVLDKKSFGGISVEQRERIKND